MRARKCENSDLIKVRHNATIYETKAKSLQTLDMIGKKQDFDLVFRTGELKRKQFPDNKLICMTEQFQVKKELGKWPNFDR